METERIALSQRDRDRLRVLHEVRQKHLCHMAMGFYQVCRPPTALPEIGNRLVTKRYQVVPTRTAVCKSLNGHAECM